MNKFAVAVLALVWVAIPGLCEAGVTCAAKYYPGQPPVVVDGDLADWEKLGLEPLGLADDTVNGPQRPSYNRRNLLE